jgi:hypothetical protein
MNLGSSTAIGNCPPLLTCFAFALPLLSSSEMIPHIDTENFSGALFYSCTNPAASIDFDVPS